MGTCIKVDHGSTHLQKLANWYIFIVLLPFLFLLFKDIRDFIEDSSRCISDKNPGLCIKYKIKKEKKEKHDSEQV